MLEQLDTYISSLHPGIPLNTILFYVSSQEEQLHEKQCTVGSTVSITVLVRDWLDLSSSQLTDTIGEAQAGGPNFHFQ